MKMESDGLVHTCTRTILSLLHSSIGPDLDKTITPVISPNVVTWVKDSTELLLLVFSSILVLNIHLSKQLSTVTELIFFRYKNALFALEFSNNWIKVLFVDSGDQYAGIQDFADLIYTVPVDGAKVTLNAGPDGNICYITMNGGEVRCFRYVATNLPPAVVATTVSNSGPVPLTVQFKADGTYDRENDQITFRWNFGDNSADAYTANPQV